MNAFFGEGGGAGVGAARTIRQRGLAGKVVVFSADMSTAAAREPADHGIVTGVADLSGQGIGKLALEQALAGVGRAGTRGDDRRGDGGPRGVPPQQSDGPVTNTMPAAFLPGNSTVELRDVQRPGIGQVPIRMRTSGICGSGIRYIDHRHLGDDPRTSYQGVVAGHETAAEVVARIGVETARPGTPIGTLSGGNQKALIERNLHRTSVPRLEGSIASVSVAAPASVEAAAVSRP